MVDTLKPCPFCGETNVKVLCCDGIEDGIPFVINSKEEYDNMCCYVHCYNCDTDIYPSSGKAIGVIKVWNTRKGENNG